MDTVSGFTSVTKEEDRVKTKINLQQFQLQLNNHYLVIECFLPFAFCFLILAIAFNTHPPPHPQMRIHGIL